MRIKEEDYPEETGSESFGDIWNKYMDAPRNYKSLFYTQDPPKRIPRLGEVRGKIYVFENESQIPVEYGIKLDSPGVVEFQDYSKVNILGTNTINVNNPVLWPTTAPEVTEDAKKRLIDEFLKRAAANSGDKFILNALNAETFIEQVATHMNEHVYEKIGPYRTPKNVGIIVMDFPGERLIYRIIATNYFLPDRFWQLRILEVMMN
jgi:hypothetical protein